MTVSFTQTKSLIKMDVFGKESIQNNPEKLILSRIAPPEKGQIFPGSFGGRFPVNG
jgi:hypothetical protein